MSLSPYFLLPIRQVMPFSREKILVKFFSLLPNLPDGNERSLDRAVLVNAAPDRYDLLMYRPIEVIRQALELNHEEFSERWAERSIQWGKAHILKGASDTFLVWKKACDLNSTPIPDGHPINAADEGLVSPSPLKPTHLLIAYDGKIQLGPTYGLRFSYVEMPINGLLFLLNIPNLTYYISTNDGDPDAHLDTTVRLPQKFSQGYELPAIAIPVPHLKTFPDLVIYLHTKNEAALFQALIPGWALEIMRPAPPPSLMDEKNIDIEEFVPSSLCCASMTPTLPRMISKLCTKLPRLNISSLLMIAHPKADHDTTVTETVAPPAEIAVSQPYSAISITQLVEAAALRPPPDVTLHEIATKLDFLRDNLTHIGYLNKDLWHKLTLYRGVVEEAIQQEVRIPKAGLRTMCLTVQTINSSQ